MSAPGLCSLQDGHVNNSSSDDEALMALLQDSASDVSVPDSSPQAQHPVAIAPSGNSESSHDSEELLAQALIAEFVGNSMGNESAHPLDANASRRKRQRLEVPRSSRNQRSPTGMTPAVTSADAAADCLHPVFLKGLCTSCGAPEDSLAPGQEPHLNLKLDKFDCRNEWSSSALQVTCSLNWAHERRHLGFRVSSAEARRRADGDLARLLKHRKLLLVLDLDHTLLNSCRHLDVEASCSSPALASFLAKQDQAAGCDCARPLPLTGDGPCHSNEPGRNAASSVVDVTPASNTADVAKDHGPTASTDAAGSSQEAQAEAPAAERNGVGPTLYHLTPVENRLMASPSMSGFQRQPPYMWTKLRPGVHAFLQLAAQLFELHVCTMGDRTYAEQMVALLDPRRVLFADRIVSSSDTTVHHVKDLDVMLGSTSAALIMDDTLGVWPHALQPNLLHVPRYVFFPSEHVRFKLPGVSHMDADTDEDPKEGLGRQWEVLESIHQAFFASEDAAREDVRIVVAAEKRRVLAGCVIVFSSVFRKGIAPMNDFHGRLAVQLGAEVQTAMSPRTTHVVAMNPCTDKALEAKRRGVHLVAPAWLITSGFQWHKQPESEFVVPLHNASAADFNQSCVAKGVISVPSDEDTLLALAAAGGGGSCNRAS